jgi:hypothetical protein
VNDALSDLQRGVKHIVRKEVQEMFVEPALRETIREAIQAKVNVEVSVKGVEQ